MKLVSAQVTNFRSVTDSGKFDITDLCCLVGKNEAGKTAILQALHGVNPLNEFEYERTKDYPRQRLTRFDQEHPTGTSVVAKTWWELDANDISKVEESFGVGALDSNEVVIEKGIGNNRQSWSIKVNTKNCIQNLVSKHKLNAAESAAIKTASSTTEAIEKLTVAAEKSEKQNQLLAELKGYRNQSITSCIVDVLHKRMPKFFYTSHYDRMAGEISLNQLTADKTRSMVKAADKIFLDFLEYAGTSIDDLNDIAKSEELVAQCEAASNDITDEIFQFWSQNEALSVKIELTQGRPGDPAPFNSGQVVKIRIRNENHRVTVPLSERSAGFVWFFSFITQFKQLRNTAGNAIILLDEPGLTLHGKAQSDLLRYIQERLLPNHQVIYSTHSPFMVPADKIADVRIVEDVVTYDDRRRPTVLGTKVTSDVLSVGKDTLFPLQGHLGYEITQSLFIGENTLLVEGPSDILYLHAFSNALNNRGRTGLDPRWTLCPTGGIDKIWPFVSLFGGNQLNVAVLCDYGCGDKRKVERLRQSELLKTSQIFTAADFSGKSESDIEDMIHPSLYAELLNRAYDLSEEHKITVKKLDESQPPTERIVKQTESLFNLLPSNIPTFDHFTPSNFLIRNPDFLDSESPELQSTLGTFEKVFETVNALLD